MCYNDFKGKKALNCKVTIISSSADFDSRVSSEGLIDFLPDGYEVTYSLDGDFCTLTVTDNTVTQKRTGSQNIFMTFSQGETTLCEIGMNGFCGGFEILTQKLTLTKGKGGIKISLEYISRVDGEKTYLTFIAALV
ncbi:MAG: DUF1934 domain-containing protein [Clostridia bacterium]|nr:DUF1934 domain-containing protein [Clostridia bacterium]